MLWRELICGISLLILHPDLSRSQTLWRAWGPPSCSRWYVTFTLTPTSGGTLTFGNGWKALSLKAMTVATHRKNCAQMSAVPSCRLSLCCVFCSYASFLRRRLSGDFSVSELRCGPIVTSLVVFFSPSSEDWTQTVEAPAARPRLTGSAGKLCWAQLFINVNVLCPGASGRLLLYRHIGSDYLHFEKYFIWLIHFAMLWDSTVP